MYKRLKMEMDEKLKAPGANIEEIRKNLFPVNGLSLAFLKNSKALPFDLNGEGFSLLLSDPTRWDVIDVLEKYFGRKARVLQAPEETIEELIKEVYEEKGNIEELVKDAEEEGYSELEEDLEHLKDRASEAPVVRLVNLIIRKAVESRASDIHFEPFEKEFKVRYRIDGVLHDVESPPKRLQAPVISRIKLMAKMDIAERRLPQDGRINIMVGGKPLDIRVSTIPTMHGESVVLRLLSKENVILEMDKLGFEGEDLETFERLIRMPYGIILVTGPTGSGKTTTLYAALSEINQSDKKIITVEDPVEYQLPGVNQIQVKPQIDLTFANALRSILRQDPDVVLIGEVRDLETADIAVHASLTGHLVFSTLHTNDAVTAITRLRDMGIENYLVSSSLVGVLAQRLVRILCPHCKEERVVDGPTAKKVEEILGPSFHVEGHTVYSARGCDECSHTGYKGREGIFELLVVDEEVRGKILRDSSAGELRECAISKGMKTLRHHGLLKVLKGITTLEEVFRVTG